MAVFLRILNTFSHRRNASTFILLAPPFGCRDDLNASDSRMPTQPGPGPQVPFSLTVIFASSPGGPRELTPASDSASAPAPHLSGHQPAVQAKISSIQLFPSPPPTFSPWIHILYQRQVKGKQ